jgi:hypothetical protein
MSFNLAFSPTGNNVQLSGSTTSAVAPLPGSSELPASVRVYNSATGVAYFRVSIDPAAVAVTTDAFVAPGATEVFNIPVGMAHVAVILATGTGTVYVQRGGGL